MTRIIRSRKTLIFATALLGFVVAVPLKSRAAAEPQDVAGAVQAKLNKSQFKDVKVSADADGIVTLTGSVNLYEYKSDAEKNALHAKGTKAVRNLISVAGPAVSDADLGKKLGEQLTYNREGYGSMYDAITLQIEDGVVTLGGHAHDYPNRDSAVALAATTPGVKDVIDNIEVDPVSQFDWGIRIAVARAVYSFPSLSQYAIDPRSPHSHLGAERSRGTVWRGRFAVRQRGCRDPRQRRSRRVQRRERLAGRRTACRKEVVNLNQQHAPRAALAVQALGRHILSFQPPGSIEGDPPA
jgi:hyperosmotically inducible protein